MAGVQSYYEGVYQNLRVQEIGSHQELECNLRWDLKLWDLLRRVGVPHSVVQVRASTFKNVGGDFTEGNLVLVILDELPFCYRSETS